MRMRAAVRAYPQHRALSTAVDRDSKRCHTILKDLILHDLTAWLTCAHAHMVSVVRDSGMGTPSARNIPASGTNLCTTPVQTEDAGVL